jgi:hypothetical protein
LNDGISVSPAVVELHCAQGAAKQCLLQRLDDQQAGVAAQVP